MQDTTSTSIEIAASEIVESAMDCFDVGSLFIIEGQGGGGKTSILETKLPEAMGIPQHRVFTVNCSGYPPSELVGYGIPDHESRDMWFAKPEVWPHREEVGNDLCLLILDEFPQWAPEAQSLCRSLFQPTEGHCPKIGTHELGPNVKIAVTANRACDGSRSRKLDAPVYNRAGTYTLVPKLEDSLEYWADKGLGLSPLFTFLEYCQGLTDVDHYNPALGRGWQGGPHATPRSWEFALRHTKDLDPTKDYDRRRLERNLKGWVGLAAGSAAVAFVTTVAEFIPKMIAIKEGRESLPSGDPAGQYSVIYAALRVANKQLKGKSKTDRGAAVKDGDLDWLVDRFIAPAEAELRGFAFRTALAVGIPLEMHAKRSMIQS